MAKPEVKIFTKDKPCTKLDLWKCFGRAGNKMVAVQVDIAHSIVGVNSVRNMERMGRVRIVTLKDSEHYMLTPEGKEWLLNGILRYLVNHPGAVSEIKDRLPTKL